MIAVLAPPGTPAAPSAPAGEEWREQPGNRTPGASLCLFAAPATASALMRRAAVMALTKRRRRVTCVKSRSMLKLFYK